MLHPDFPSPESPPVSVTKEEYEKAWELRYGKGSPYGENPLCFIVDSPIPHVRDDGSMYPGFYYVQYFCPCESGWRKRTREFAKHILDDHKTIGAPPKPDQCAIALEMLKSLTGKEV